MAEKKRYTNDKVKERTKDPITGSQFIVYFGNSVKIGFSRISNISLAKDVGVITDTANDRKHLYTHDDDDERLGDNILVLERGMTRDESDKLLRTYIAGVNIPNLQI
ncbi:MAG: hypothetical protein IJ679_05760, partial [Lachnospiraceae bacterium]|nr:hypothetical protein [Lachnospiraceae bacterium]